MAAQLSPVSSPGNTYKMNPRALADVVRDSFFQYGSNAFTFTVGNENLQQSIQIQSDAHFLCTSLSYTNTAEVGNSANQTATPYVRISNGGALVQITDGSSQRFLSNVQVPLSTLFGPGFQPHILELTHLFRANGFINVSLTGMNNAAPFAGQVIRLVFSGFKVPVGMVPALDFRNSG
jgi:hypothetical protein